MSLNVQGMARRLLDNVGIVIVGKEAEIELCIIALLCRGHLLIEDVPGTGKTMLAKALAASTGCTFERVQFTPDLLPSDVVGVSVYNPQAQTFEFRRGPVFTQVLLADEINRATPKTQSALLEAMEEWQVTVDGTTHLLPEPFIVMATQNPIELGGTFPLPEAQVDRFLLKVGLGYLPGEEEVAMLDRFQAHSPLEGLEPVASSTEILSAQEVCRAVFCDPSLKEYCVRLVQRTRDHVDVALGASPRGSLGLLHAAQARAAINGRDFVLPDDIKDIAPHVLTHRVILRPNAELRGLTPSAVVDEVIATEAVPMTSRRLA
ncbi:MAG TPA: MoxR family ATPase [Candidatus Acidoferrales bacterium]|jgi:MoxR-like ATPase|nr:MoxR family ATPase [Candidatus Acidoferrales bacterium]